MLSDAQLASMQATLLGSLPDTCQIGRYTPASDGAGGTDITYPLDAAIPCRIGANPASFKAAEQLIAGEEEAVAPWVITLPFDTLLDERDRIVSAGRVFEVSRVEERRSWQLDVRVLCRPGNEAV